jgi:hypothetical protein
MKSIFRIVFLSTVFFLTTSLFLSSAEAQNRAQGGADSQEGWVIRRTERGIIKVPKRQKFRFEGSDIQGDVDRPSQSVLGARVPRQNTSLIPVRSSFREEYLGVSGLPER